MPKKKRTLKEKAMQDTTEQSAQEARAEAIDPSEAAAEAIAEDIETPEAEAETAEESTVEPKNDEAARAAEELKQALQKQEEYLQLAQRVQADFENYRRRNKDVRREAFDDGARAFATTLLPVLDNLERAIQAAGESDDKALLEGVRMVERMLADAFEKRGITAIDRLGQPFDPNLENAVLNGEPEDGEPGSVCAVLQKGYTMGGIVLRHAMVKVVPE